MKTRTLIAAFIVTAALTAFGQEGVVQDVKHGAKKAGETIKDGLETAGEKTKEAAKTVGKKTKETADTVATKTKETVNGTGEKAAGSTQTTHHKSRKAVGKTKPQVTEEQTTNRGSTTPATSPTP
jgi:hypothetical protein